MPKTLIDIVFTAPLVAPKSIYISSTAVAVAFVILPSSLVTEVKQVIFSVEFAEASSMTRVEGEVRESSEQVG